MVAAVAVVVFVVEMIEEVVVVVVFEAVEVVVVAVVEVVDFEVVEDVETDINKKEIVFFFLPVICHFLYDNINYRCCFFLLVIFTKQTT